jgi:hypothetical protein
MKTTSYLKMKLKQNALWIVGLSAAAMLVLGCVVVNQIIPVVPGGLRSGESRLAWYVQSGQWRADVRTASQMAGYMISPDNDIPTGQPDATNHQVVTSPPRSHQPQS